MFLALVSGNRLKGKTREFSLVYVLKSMKFHLSKKRCDIKDYNNFSFSLHYKFTRISVAFSSS
jgi:hypothetical protein